jgi:hypothetical protein
MDQPIQRGFQFEAVWLRALDHRDVLEKAWNEGSDGSRSLHPTWSNLNHVAASLKDWSRATFGSVRKKISQLEGKLQDIREHQLSDQSVQEEKVLQTELCELFEREEIMARQRS